MKLRLTGPDIILIGTILAASLLWAAVLNRSDNDDLVVAYYTREGLQQELSLDVDTRIHLPGPLGESIVETSRGTVSMLSSPCPNKLCIHMGVISGAHESIICIPNRVHVLIRSKKQAVDSISY
ncbi:MAG: NusG domain II-containing protein [Desulfomonilia bacterium]|nr:NusG domain II-containing protein [Desulfomonilia bacterium]